MKRPSSPIWAGFALGTYIIVVVAAAVSLLYVTGLVTR